jgi:two-component system, sensor histidine kinase and response regulator
MVAITKDRRRKPRPLRIVLAIGDVVSRTAALAALPSPFAQCRIAEGGANLRHISETQDHDLLICDSRFRDEDGTLAYTFWRNSPRQKHVPILLLADASDLGGIEAAYEAGVAGFLTHPVAWPLLGTYIRFLLREARSIAQVRHALEDAEAHSRTRDNLLSIIRHEMRTPLNAISGFTRLAQESQANGDVSALNAHLDRLVESGKDLLHTIGDMALYSDLTAGRITPKWEDTAPEWLVDDAIQLKSRAIAARAIALNQPEKASGLAVMGDVTLLSSAFARVIDNTLRHAQDAHTITFTIASEGDGLVRITIGDDGEGMDPAAIPACLAPFSQRDMSLARANQGLGLGLPIAAEIAKLHGGSLTMQASSGKGVAVTFLLPRAG